MTTAILAKSLRDRRRALIGNSLGLVALVVWLGALFPILRDNQGFNDIMEQVPPEMFAAVGTDLATFLTAAGFLSAEFFALFAPLLILIFVISAMVAETSTEEREGLMDMVLSNPVSRRRVFLEKAGGVAAATLLMVTVITAALLAVNPVFGLDLPVVGVVAAGLSLWLLGTSFGAAALLVGAFTGRSATAGGMAGLLALLAWFVTSFSGLFPWLEGAGGLSPFTWYREPNPLVTGFGAGHLWLLITTAILLVVAVLLFDRRDIATERAALPDVKVRRRARRRARQPRAAWLLTDPFRKVIWDRRRSVWGWGGGLGLLSLAMFSAWPALAQDAEALAALITSMPREVFVMFGMTNPDAIVTPAGFVSSRSYQSIGPIVVIFFCVRGVSMALVRQEGSGVLDLVLAHPASRSRTVASKLAAVAFSAGLVVLIPTVVALLADRRWETGLGVGSILAAGAGLYLLGLFFAGLALLLWGFKGTSLPAVRIAGIAALATFLMNGLGALADGLRPIRLVSPFYWYFGDDPPLAKGFEPSYFLLLAGTVAMAWLAIARFRRRDTSV
ncbi:MAG: ABC transporter permease subunit [bacterium]|nr:ABC transporter permease subunit [bacterium]MDE0351415.1 ABC transporter permease subunit [bacterium]